MKTKKNTKHLYQIVCPPNKESQQAELHMLLSDIGLNDHAAIEYAKLLRRKKFRNGTEQVTIGEITYTIRRTSKLDIMIKGLS